MSDVEVIAMVLPEDSGIQVTSSTSGEPRATVLVREPDGRVLLETVTSSSKLGRFAQKLGCFRRRSPIVDPVTRQIVGYELEMVPSPMIQMR